MTFTLRLALPAAALTLLAACATQAPPAASPAPTSAKASVAPTTAAAAAGEFYAVMPESGRIYVFGDIKNYKDFLAHGEVTLTRTQIGAGPGGRTLVYGITKADVKANMPSLGEQIMAGSLAPSADFYGEVMKNGRFYLFGDMKEMKDFIAHGEVAYGYTDIGVGPKGESLVYVMNKASYKKGKPMDRFERFKSLHMAAV